MKFSIIPSARNKNQDHRDFSGLPQGARSTIVTFVFFLLTALQPNY